ncbi:DUF3037 domain-containing protein [Anabaena sp. PCC 7108]|uniref:DUF3037 domain-containing protein n=1 Tax=Anabaena sp. PCC 7108 TaxID=163908 RepID=UPI000347B3C5|nr:DUF3037 domain-containing protein [Anabaena sp. PCC 7108]
MASRYSIIQYVPDPITDERINIGVIAFDKQNIRIRFLKNWLSWKRVQIFGMEDIKFLKDFAHRMEKNVKEGYLFSEDNLNEVPYQERILKIAQEWINSIQITEPRGSLDSVDNLLEDIANTYLREIKPPSKPKGSITSRRRQKIVSFNLYPRIKTKLGEKPQ